MTQEQKQLLLKDLCARLPYGVICKLSAKGANVSITEKLDTGGLEHFIFGTMDVKPYLRPMSSMTKEEVNEFSRVLKTAEQTYFCKPDDVYNVNLDIDDWQLAEEFFLRHHLDYRGLIPMGLALEAKEGMYKTE